MESFSEKCVILKKAFKEPFKGHERYHAATIGNNGSDNLQCGNFLQLTNGKTKIPVVVSDVCTWNGKDDSTRINIKVAKDERYDMPRPEMCNGDFDLCAYPITEDFRLSNGLSDRMALAYSVSLAETSAYGVYMLEISLAGQKLLCKTVEYVHQVQNLLSCFGIGCVVKRPFSEDSPSSRENMRYEMVDLGLPSGLKWADRNVGAASPEDYGDYFMWGSVTPDTENACFWNNAPFNGGRNGFFQPYFESNKPKWLCESGNLRTEYDCAIERIGDGWRMPTERELVELISNTNQYDEELCGVKGKRLISKVNGNSIFIPFSGAKEGFYSEDDGNYGNLWSCSLSKYSESDSYGLALAGNSACEVGVCSRYYGLAVRGVHE